jgi:hypothetical protein
MIDNQNRQLNQMSGTMGARQMPGMVPPPAPTSSPSSSSDIDSRLSRIENTLEKLSGEKSTPSSSSTTAMAEIDTPKYGSSTSSHAKSHKRTTTSSHHHTYKKKTQVAHRSASRPSAFIHSEPQALQASTSQWVLRAATPKEAWVSGDATSAELRHVQVGDDLPGVGIVRSIHQSPSGWEIEGTGGMVR